MGECKNEACTRVCERHNAATGLLEVSPIYRAQQPPGSDKYILIYSHGRIKTRKACCYSNDFRQTYTWSSFYPASPTCRIPGIRRLRDTCLHMCRWMDPRNSTTVDILCPKSKKKFKMRVRVYVQAQIECQSIVNEDGWKHARKRRSRVETHTV